MGILSVFSSFLSLVLVEDRRGPQIPWNGLKDIVSHYVKAEILTQVLWKNSK